MDIQNILVPIMILFFLGNEDHKFKLIYEKDYGHYDIIEIGEAKYY